MTGDTTHVGQTHLVDSDKESQPATGRETNRPAGQHRSNISLSLSDNAAPSVSMICGSRGTGLVTAVLPGQARSAAMLER